MTVEARRILVEPIFSLFDIFVELLVVCGVFQMRFQTQGQLQDPRPLTIHGGHVRLDAFRGRVVLQQ